eukprot:TRINITY_DN34_c0_g1_i1.p2 TRINITY_DN34_c0_g1~~TRINITY_DN34_c0_g1_i1.p2  ORF type:complete len:440 (+),score=80.50 TRINITY_DN34_c0_g1_i1:54-1322(+)
MVTWKLWLSVSLLAAHLVPHCCHGTPTTNTFVPVSDLVLVSQPNGRGVSQVVAVGETVATRNGPKVGDKVSVDSASCSSTPAPGLEGHCLVPQKSVFGTVQPISNVLSVTPSPVEAPVVANVTVKGRLYAQFVGFDNTEGAPTPQVAVNGLKKQYLVDVLPGGEGYYTYEATVPVNDIYNCSIGYNTMVNAGNAGNDQFFVSGVTATWRGDHVPVEDFGNGYVDIAASAYVRGKRPVLGVQVTSIHDQSDWKIDELFFVAPTPTTNSRLQWNDFNTQAGEFSYQYSGGFKKQKWASTDFSGEELTPVYSTGSLATKLQPGSYRFTGVWVAPQDTVYNFEITGPSFDFYLNDQLIKSTTSQEGTFKYDVSFGYGARVPFRLDVIVPSKSTYYKMQIGHEQPGNQGTKPLSAYVIVPDEKVTLY